MKQLKHNLNSYGTQASMPSNTKDGNLGWQAKAPGPWFVVQTKHLAGVRKWNVLFNQAASKESAHTVSALAWPRLQAAKCLGVDEPRAENVLFQPSTQNSFDFPASLRLKKRHEFLRVQRDGVRAFGKALVLIGKSRPSTKGRLGRVGFTVSKKVGNAVQRNLIKRRLRSIVRHNKSVLIAQDLVILVQPQAASRNFAGLEAELHQTLNHLAKRSKKTKHCWPKPRSEINLIASTLA